MRAQEFTESDITEIERLPSRGRSAYTGTRDLELPRRGVKRHALGAELSYAVDATGAYPNIFIIAQTPEGARTVGFLELRTNARQMPEQTYQVETINVWPEYRGRGLAKIMYWLALQHLGPLLAGITQTIASRRVWASLSQKPGIRVSAYVYMGNNARNQTMKNRIRQSPGCAHWGTTGNLDWWLIPVQPGARGELVSTIPGLNIYTGFEANDHGRMDVGLIMHAA